MADQITIQSIHPEAKQMVVVFNIEGKTYPKVLPFLTTQDAELLKQQLQSFAQELRGEFDALKAAIQQADANATPSVSDAVTALTGQAIPVDTTPAAPETPATPADPGTPSDTTTPPAGETQTPADQGTQEQTTGQDQSTSTASATEPTA